MGLVGSTGRKRPHQLALEENEDSDREDKDLEEDNVEEISPRRLRVRDMFQALYNKPVFYCLPVEKRYKRRQFTFMKPSLSKEPTRMSWSRLSVSVTESLAVYNVSGGVFIFTGTEWKLHKTYLSQVQEVYIYSRKLN